MYEACANEIARYEAFLVLLSGAEAIVRLLIIQNLKIGRPCLLSAIVPGYFRSYFLLQFRRLRSNGRITLIAFYAPIVAGIEYNFAAHRRLKSRVTTTAINPLVRAPIKRKFTGR